MTTTNEWHVAYLEGTPRGDFASDLVAAMLGDPDDPEPRVALALLFEDALVPPDAARRYCVALRTPGVRAVVRDDEVRLLTEGRGRYGLMLAKRREPR